VNVLFVMASPEYLRFYDSTIEELAARGHRVTLAVNNQREKKPVGLEGLHAYAGRVVVAGVVPEHEGTWGAIGFGIRAIQDFVRYLHPRFAAAPVLRARIKRKVLPVAFRWIDAVPSLPVSIVRRAIGALAACERAVPVSHAIAAFLREQAPDVLLVSPMVDAASDQVEWVKAAQALGIRTAVCVASWDNLTNKGHLRVLPDLVIVWNEAQKQEAVEYHAVPPARVAVTGAQLFDRWFTRSVTRDRAAFCARVGLPDTRPFLLFTGSSSFISESNAEVAFVRRWVAALRASADPWVRELNVLMRPHPYNCHAWETTDVSDLPHVAVWPRRGYNPVDEDNRADFFDSLYHSSAVVGINTSAMIEAAIVGRPVFSMLTSEFAGTQEGTLHFHHLLPEHGGCVRIASTLEEHVAQLGERLNNPEAARAETERFVASFVRPHGLERPATPIVVDAIERLVAAPAPAPQAAPAWGVFVQPVLLVVGAASGVVGWVSHPELVPRLRKRVRQPLHRWTKQARRTYGIARDRSRRGLRAAVKRVARVPSIQDGLARAVSRGWRRVRRQARQARYHAAVFVRGGVPRNEDRRG
jgi:hypothetical protein